MSEPKFGKNRGLLSDLGGFLAESRKWWLAPVVIALLLMGVLVILGGTAAAPFIYSLF